MFVVVRRAFAALTLLVLVAAMAAAPANADTAVPGVGSTNGSSALVSVDLGNLLQLGLLQDNGNGTIDPAVGTPIANESLTPLAVTSGALPALDALSVPVVSTSSTGAADQKSVNLINLSSLPQPVPVLDGTINAATLSSAVDANGAQTLLASTLANVGLLGGVARLQSGGISLSGLAAPTSSNVNRTASLDALTVLDLRGLLNLLGIDLNLLSTNQLTTLVGELGVLGAVNSAVPGLNASTPDDLLNTIDTTVQNLADLAAITVCTGTEPVLLLLGIDCSGVASTITDLTTQLTDIVQGIVDTLGDTPLLQVQGVQAGAVATATNSVDTSVANVVASIGHILVGGVDLGGIDANTTIAQVQNLAAQVTTQINSILGSISPSLANVVSLALFERTTNVNASNGYVNALASVNALRVTITPPDVCAVLSDIAGGSLPDVPINLPASPVSTVLSGLGSTIDCSSIIPAKFAPNALPGNLNAVTALVSPVTLRVASVTSGGNFTVPVASSTPTGTPLALTGIDETLLLLVGGLLAAGALLARRTILRVEPAEIRRRR